MPEVNAMYPELKLHAIGWVKHKCIPGAKWPEIQAVCALMPRYASSLRGRCR